MNDTRLHRVSILARVECRSETRGEEIPVALWMGGERLQITEVFDRAVLGGARAGAPHRQRWWVKVADGQRFELVRTLPHGRWQVMR